MFQNQRGFVVPSADLGQPASRDGGFAQVEYWTSRAAGYAVLLGVIVLGGILFLG
jgi:hypothetical protein